MYRYPVFGVNEILRKSIDVNLRVRQLLDFRLKLLPCSYENVLAQSQVRIRNAHEWIT